MSAGIAACGFVRATPIQAATLPLLLAGQDVAAQAQTGTGKTAAYLVAIFTRFVRTKRHKASGNPRALIVAPTRELAVQIQEDARALGHFLKMRIVTVFGGIDYGRQRDQLRAGCDLLIGTPGRLLDYEQQGATSFGEVESLVIDEADRLFDLGLHQGPETHPPPLPAPGPPALDALLGHALDSRDGAGVRALERREEDRDPARADHRRPRHAGALSRLTAREDPAPARPPAARGRRAHDALREHEALRRASRLEPGKARIPHRSAHRRHPAGAAPQDPPGLQERRAAAARRHGRRVARSPHRGRHARHQRGPSPGPRGLRSPDRTHGACRPVGQGHLARGRGLRVFARRDSAPHRDEDPRGVRGQRALRGAARSRARRERRLRRRRGREDGASGAEDFFEGGRDGGRDFGSAGIYGGAGAKGHIEGTRGGLPRPTHFRRNLFFSFSFSPLSLHSKNLLPNPPPPSSPSISGRGRRSGSRCRREDSATEPPEPPPPSSAAPAKRRRRRRGRRVAGRAEAAAPA